MKKCLFILMIFLIAAGGMNLFAGSAYFPIIKLADTTSEYFIENCFPGLSLNTRLLCLEKNSITDTIILDKMAVDARDPRNWVVNQFNHTGLLVSLITFATGFGLYVGGGAVASEDLGVALVLMTIGVPVNCAGCLLADFFLQGLHNKYKAKGAEIKENNVLWSWILSGVGVALFAGSIAVPFIVSDSFTGAIISISLGGTAMIVNILDFYLVKQAWLREINVGIIEKGLTYP